MAIDPVTSVATAIAELAKVIKQAFDGKNRKLLLEIKMYKNKAKACDIAESIFGLTDIDHIPHDDHKLYWKLRKKFDDRD